MPRFSSLAACAVLALGGCSASDPYDLGVAPPDDSGPQGDPSPDDDPPPDDEPAPAYDYAGNYSLEATWDLSAPFRGDGLGGLLADLLVEEMVTRAGLPADLEDSARALLQAQLREPVVATVNDVVPPALAADSELMTTLASALSAVEVDSVLRLEALDHAPYQFTSDQEITAIRVHANGELWQLDLQALLGDGGVTLGASGEGSVADAYTLGFDAHDLQLRYGALVALVAQDVIGVDPFALADRAADSIDCEELVAQLSGGEDHYDFKVGGQTFSVSVTPLIDTCVEYRADIARRALGLFSLDAGLRLGGEAAMIDTDGDLAIDELVSLPGYGGVITALPLGIEPAIAVSFTATR